MSSLWRRQQREEREREQQELQQKLLENPPPPPPPPPLPASLSTPLKKPRICVSFKPTIEKGGSHHFTITLLNYLKNKCVFTYNLDEEYDILFVIADLFRDKPLDFIKNKKTEGVKIVHRVDGCFYHHGYEAGGKRDVNQRHISKLADMVIHQSQWGKRCLEDMGVIDRHINNVVIYNGVDRSIYTAAKHRMVSPFTIISANNSRLQIKRVDRLNLFVRPDVRITHLGLYHKSVVLDKSIQVIKPVSPNRLNGLYSTAQAFIHTGDLDTCPNAVIEAMATGLPIIHWGSGGVPELVGDAGLVVGDFPSIDKLIEALKQNYITLHQNAINRVTRFDISTIGEEYMNVFRSVL